MAMFEEKLIAYLHDQTGLRVSNLRSAGRIPAEYILVQRTNGSRRDKIDSATYAVQSISSASKLRAAEINEQVKAAMESFEGEAYVSMCRLNADYDYTDPQRKEYRYQSVYDIVYF